MGSFFSAPTPAAPPPPPTPVAAPDPDEEARKAREQAVARNRRGRQGLIATSERGLAEGGFARKSLLGE